MKKFLRKLLLYLAPFCVLALPFLYVAVKSKEIMDYDKIIKAQNISENALVGMGYNEQTVYYKYKNTVDKKPDVIALGTSRVMQFRSLYFKIPFYNCGGAVSGNYDEYLNFLKNLESAKLPQYILLGLDSWVFNDNWNNNYSEYKTRSIDKYPIKKMSIIKRIVDDYSLHKWNFRQILEGYDNIGFNGIVKGNGFQKDGSYYIYK